MTDRARITCGILSGLCVIAMLWLALGGTTVPYEEGDGLSSKEHADTEPFTVDCNPVTWGLLRHWTDGDRELTDAVGPRSGYSITDGTVPGTDAAAEVAGRCEQTRSGQASFLALLAVPAAVLGTAATVSRRREPRDTRPGQGGTISSGSH